MFGYNRKADVVVPWIAFAAILAVTLWMKYAYGNWWSENISTDYLPSKTLYNVLWLTFIVIYPFAYMFAIASCQSQSSRILMHIIFLGIALFLILWMIYMYMVRDVKTARLFLGIAAAFVLLGVFVLWFHHSSVAGVLVLFFLWILVNWYLVRHVHNKRISSMVDTIKERFESS